MPPQGFKPLRTLVAAAFFTLASAPLALISCGAETAGKAIEFATAVRGGSSSGAPTASFVNARGWNVELTRALAALGPIYFYSAEPLARARWSLLGTAHACPAHAQQDKGLVLGEMLEQRVIDLLAAVPTEVATSAGQAGTCRMLELHLHAPGEVPGAKAADLAALGGHTLWVEGRATKDGQTVEFEGGLTIPDEGTMRIVENVAADVALDEATVRPGRAVVVVLLDRWFANVDFASLSEPGAQGRLSITEDTQAHLAWMAGARSRASYALEWSQP